MNLPCRICAAPTQTVFSLRSRRHPIDVAFYHCRACRAYFSRGGPVHYDDVDLTRYYASSAVGIRHRYTRMFDFLETMVSPARFIDIGAGMGYSLEVAQARGWTAAGIEPNASLVRSALERGLTVTQGYLDDRASGQYELVVIDNVLEHVPQPKEFLVNAARLLAPGGLMVVAIPPLDWIRSALGSLRMVRERVHVPQINVFDEVDEHVNVMGRRAMRKLVAAVGLKLESTRFHHSPLFRNAIARALAVDDGYYFIRAAT
jgi:SAM-dependent methyltransferase